MPSIARNDDSAREEIATPRRLQLVEPSSSEALLYELLEEKAALERRARLISKLTADHANTQEQLRNVRELAEKLMEATEEKDRRLAQLQHALQQKNARISELELQSSKWDARLEQIERQAKVREERVLLLESDAPGAMLQALLLEKNGRIAELESAAQDRAARISQLEATLAMLAEADDKQVAQ